MVSMEVESLSLVIQYGDVAVAKQLSEYLVRCLYGIGQIAVVKVTVEG